MVHFDTKAYNNLPLIADADALFQKQLASAGITRSQLFLQLVPLFLQDGNVGRYAICLVHHHYDLKAGERMVSTGRSTKPSTDTSVNIVPSSWLNTGEVIEFMFTPSPSTLPPPPSAEFFTKFRSILDAKNIDVLGICYAPDDLDDGFMLRESRGVGDRVRVLTAVHGSTPMGADCYLATWIPKVDPDNGSYVVVKAGCCDGQRCGQKPPPPVTPPRVPTPGNNNWSRCQVKRHLVGVHVVTHLPKI